MKRKILIIAITIMIFFGEIAGYIPGIYVLCKTSDEKLLYYSDLYEVSTDYDVLINRFYLSETPDLKEYYVAAEEVLSGNAVSVSSAAAFQRYFSFVYQISAINDVIGLSVKDGTISVYGTNETEESRQEVIDLAIETIGVEEVDNPYFAVISAVFRIRSFISYDTDFMQATMEEALADGKGVCVHYAQLMKIILNAEGIPCRVVYGTRNGIYHDWDEVYIDGSWYIVDVCIEPTGFVYIPIRYKEEL